MADAAAMGSIMIPAMRKNGYRPSFAAAITAASSMIGPVMPPSIAASTLCSSFTNIYRGDVFSWHFTGFCDLSVSRNLYLFLYSGKSCSGIRRCRNSTHFGLV